MDVKWIAIMVIGVVAFIFVPVSVEMYSQNQAKAECYKAMTEAIKNKVEAPRCDKETK